MWKNRYDNTNQHALVNPNTNTVRNDVDNNNNNQTAKLDLNSLECIPENTRMIILTGTDPMRPITRFNPRLESTTSSNKKFIDNF